MNGIFTIFTISTGKIQRVVTCPVGMANAQLGVGEDFIEGRWPDDLYYIEGYAPTPIPTRPSNHHQFNWAIKQWEDPRTLVDHKAAKWAEVKAAREAVEFGAFAWDGSMFDCDQISQQRIQGAAQLATLASMTSAPFSIDWTLADNTVRTLNATDMIAVGMALGAHINVQHATSRTLRAQIDAATTLAEVQAVAWPG